MELDFEALGGFQNLSMAAVFLTLAGLVRGYTGFGYAAIAILALNFIWSPQLSVPVILLLDLIGSIGLIRSALPYADRGFIKRLGTGALFGMPIGLGIILMLPAIILKLATNLVVLLLTGLIALTENTPKIENPILTRIVGGISGALTSAASVGGLPLVIYLLNSPLDVRVQRGSLIVFLIFTDSISLVLLCVSGVLNSSVITPVAFLLVPTLIGVQLGQWAFHKHPPKSFRPIALPIIAVLSVSGLLLNITDLI